MKTKLQKFIVLFVACLIFGLHWSYLPNGFVWLDHGDIEEKRALVSLKNLHHAFLTPFGATGFYRPLVTMSLSTDYALYGPNAPGFHFTNLLLHIAVALVTPFFLSLFFVLTFPEMILIMFLVGVHPLGWLPAGAIAYRPELLVTFFTFATVFFHAKARKSQSPFFATSAVICFLFGLLAKETALFLIPSLILLWEFTTKQKNVSWKNSSFQVFVPEVFILLLYSCMRMLAVPSLWNVAPYKLTLQEGIGTRLAAVGKLSQQFFVPFTPPLSDAVPIQGLFNSTSLIVIILFVCAVAFFVKQGRDGIWIKASLLFLILLLPALAIVPVPRLGSPHYGYIPLAGVAIFIVLFMRELLRITYVKQISLFCLAIWLITMSYGAFIGGKRFTNDETLFAPEVANDTRFYEGYFYLGNYYFTHKMYSKAEEAYQRAVMNDTSVVAYQERTAAYINFALLELQQGDKAKAMRLLNEAKKNGNPAFVKSINLLQQKISQE